MRVLVVANWKMNPPTWKEAKKLFETTKKMVAKTKISLVIAPPSLYLRELAHGQRGHIAFAVQRARAEDGGAYTGEISMQQAKDVGAKFAIVGHSEVRIQGETDENIRRQVAAALTLQMTPILCVGETQRAPSGDYFKFVAEQLRVGLGDVSAARLARVIVAYEPVWAIGGEQTVRPRDMNEMAIFIRKSVVTTHGDGGFKVKILYGGSANEENAASMLESGGVNGILVGHVSVDASRFTALLSSF